MAIRSLALHDLGVVTGGDFHGPGQVVRSTDCTSQPPQAYWSAPPSGPTMRQRVDNAIANVDRAMLPWQTFNGIFAGAAGSAFGR